MKNITEEIYEEIKKHGKKITYSDLRNKFHLNNETLDNYLEELKINGRIIQKRNHFYLFPNDEQVGDIAITSKGNVILYSNGLKYDVHKDENFPVILNDIVSFKINENNEAIVTSILKRQINIITCRVGVYGGRKKVIPYYKDLDVRLNDKIMDTLLEGDVILVQIGENNESDNYVKASYIKKIGNSNDPNIDEIEIAINYGFDNNYSDEYLEELNNLPKEVSEEETLGRTDFRNITSFTIDGINTKDMDDALSVEMRENNNIVVYVHIADVSHYVKNNSCLFKRACEKTTSLYLGNSVFHMFHHIISNGICSLNPNVDRLTKTVRMEINEEGRIVSSEIVKSVINSKIKMNYDEVDKILSDKEFSPEYLPYINDLNLLNEASKRLEKRYIKINGKLDFASRELDPTYDESGATTNLDILKIGEGRKLIENLMIAANETVAKYLAESQLPSVYRIHETPEIDRINATITTLNENGFNIKKVKDVSNPKSIQKVLHSIEQLEEYTTLSTILLRFMKRARYSTENLGHFALGLNYYTHFTSPIRRLPDLLIHKLLDILLEEDKLTANTDLNELEQILNELCQRASDMERKADEAERQVDNLTVLKYLKEHIDEEYMGSVTNIGKTIIIKIYGLECILNEEVLDKYYKYDYTKKKYYNSSTKKYINLGSTIPVKIDEIDITKKIVIVSPSILDKKVKVLKK